MEIVDFTSTDKLPLGLYAVPAVVDFWVSGTCNMRCVYCLHGLGHSDPVRSDIVEGQLSWENFQRVAEGMAEFPHAVASSFCGVGEPLTHPRLEDMIAYLKGNGLVTFVELTTNALLLTHERAARLIEAGVDLLSVSVQGVTAQSYQRTCGVSCDPHVIAERIAWYKEHCGPHVAVIARTLDVALYDEGDEQRFHDMFDNVADQAFVGNAVRLYQGMDYSQLIPVELDQFGRGTPVYAPACPLAFATLHIRPNGDIAVCPLPKCPAILGNVATTSLTQAWESRERYELLYSHACERREEYAACNGCTQPDMLSPGVRPSEALKAAIAARRASACHLPNEVMNKL